MVVRLINEVGQIKEAKIGFSWSNFFLGPVTPLVRGDFKYFIIMLICLILTCGISWLVFPFIYNKLYIIGLLLKGYLPVSKEDKQILIYKGFIDA